VHAPRLQKSESYHLFLSHVWGTGQDQMRIVKQRLLEMVTNLAVFLDVDDLEEIGDLGCDIDASQVVAIFCSDGYAQSKNCMIELRAAVAKSKPLIALLETETKHGGVTQAQMCEQLTEAESRFEGWGFESEPGSAELIEQLFAKEPIEWNRLGPMQDVTLRLIAERMMVEEIHGTTYVQGELVQTRSVLRVPSAGHTFHLYCSRHNAGAEALAVELAAARKLTALKHSADRDELPRCEVMLVYLTGKTWASAAFADEVEAAMRSGKRLLLAHEMPGLGHEAQARHTVEFGNFFADGQTPSTLVAAGIYSSIAVPLKGGPWREASMALLAKAVGLQDRAQVSLPFEWVCSFCLGGRARVNEAEGGGDILHSRGGLAIVRSARPREASAEQRNPRRAEGESVRINKASRSDRGATIEYDAHEQL